MTGVDQNRSLPFAYSLCGACFDACPVAIDIPTMLVHLRARVVDANGATLERVTMRAAAWTMRSPRRWAVSLRALRLGRILRGRRALPPPLSKWTAGRELPEPPRQTFRDWWRAQ
jgi:L-lactate dehydrogenase complex protein LldF